MIIRQYRKSDFGMIRRWWIDQGEVAPTEGMLPESSSFILEDEYGIPLLCVSLFLTNCELAWVENFVGNPQLRGELRQAGTILLLDHIAQFAAKLGYVRLVCQASNDKLRAYYSKIGFTETLSGLTSFAKEISLCPRQH